MAGCCNGAAVPDEFKKVPVLFCCSKMIMSLGVNETTSPNQQNQLVSCVKATLRFCFSVFSRVFGLSVFRKSGSRISYFQFPMFVLASSRAFISEQI